MKRLVFALTLTAAAGFSFSFAQAEEQGEIIYQAKSKNIFRAAESAAQRDRRATYRAPIKFQYDGFVNRSEGLATAREEHTGPVVVLHCVIGDWTTIRGGHALAN